MPLFFVIFFAVIAVAIFLLNFFLYYPVTRAYNLNKKQRKLTLLFFLLFTLLMISGETTSRIWGANWFSCIGRVIMGVLSISLSVMIVNIIIYLVAIITKGITKIQPADLFRYTTTLSLILIFFFSGYAFFNNERSPIVKHYTINSEKMTADTEGLRVILISDLHVIGNTRVKKLQNIINLINAQKPDLVLIAGDLIDESWENIERFAPIFNCITATYGTYAVKGNHDYYNDVQTFLNFTEAGNIKILTNESTQIIPGISLVGIPDPTSERMGFEAPDPAKAFTDVNIDDYVIFMAHQPLYYNDVDNADLILAEHTHRGQIPPMTFIVKWHFRYPYGLYKPNDRQTIYTTSGVSIWGPPMRLFTNNEIVVFTLQKQQ